MHEESCGCCASRPTLLGAAGKHASAGARGDFLGHRATARSKRERSLRRAFERVAGLFVRSPWTDEVSHTYGQIKARTLRLGTPIEDFDLAIAAHALVERATLAADNTRHFSRVAGLELENWLRDH